MKLRLIMLFISFFSQLHHILKQIDALATEWMIIYCWHWYHRRSGKVHFMWSLKTLEKVCCWSGWTKKLCTKHRHFAFSIKMSWKCSLFHSLIVITIFHSLQVAKWEINLTN
jgi:hypothetical protein